jgi:GTP cyclohydrolase-4
LLATLEEAASSPTYEYLKRHEEGVCVNSLHWKPRLVEDVIRESMARVAQEFLNWPDELSVRMSVTNFESASEYVLDAHTASALGEIKPMFRCALLAVRKRKEMIVSPDRIGEA